MSANGENEKNKEQAETRRARRIELYIAVAATTLLVGVSLVAIVILKEFLARQPAVGNFLAPVAAILAGVVALLGYLGSSVVDSKKSSSESLHYLITKAILSMLGLGHGTETAFRVTLKSPAAGAETASLPAEDQLRLVSALEQKIMAAAAEDAFRTGVLKNVLEIQRDVAHSDRLARINAQFDATRVRLDQAIVLLHKKANVNMAVGILLSSLGIVFLGVTVVPGLFEKLVTLPTALLAADDLSTPTAFWMHYVPRVTLAIVLELFAYFFLNLYKANAAETRYYHNEITNLSARHAALIAASDPIDAALLKLVIDDLLKTERNGILTKSQTTVEIARAKAEAEASKDLVSIATKLVESLARPSNKPDEK
ncbi:hypothetical protein [Burkholderia anthina]|uniref:hypothetical protein n=1 Tax=Burkholderia anthina TaxID=179879 RepID=UPI000F598CF7|nr:hypothetical protein [Burkholderia anthina]RQV71536.1 hypothetical protein DF160_33515 [Burkholderia anthina]